MIWDDGESAVNLYALSQLQSVGGYLVLIGSGDMAAATGIASLQGLDSLRVRMGQAVVVARP